MVSNLFSIFLLLFLVRCTYVHDDFLIVPLLEDQYFWLLLHETGKPEAMNINLVCNYLFLMKTRNNNGCPFSFEFFDVIHLLPLSLFVCHFHFPRSQTYLTLIKYIK
jgi:hypothetical protein